jgi:hypothetical protein
MSGGRVVRSGHGLSIFKWPSDSVTIVSTAIRKLSFRADQVTREKAGVDVTGLAVYRIVEPLLAFRMLDGDVGGLGEILRDMFIGATRRIVASLTLDECITHRKERVAEALMSEIAPVLAGAGRPEDGTDAGWGVVLDTIEIQDVRVLSAEVFARLQAPFREKIALDALRAEQEVARARERFELDRTAADAQLHEQRVHAELALRRQSAEAERERVAIELDVKRSIATVEADVVRMQREAEADLSDARLREILLTRTVPEVAASLRGMVDRVHITTTDANVGRLLDAGADVIAGLLQAKRG